MFFNMNRETRNTLLTELRMERSKLDEMIGWLEREDDAEANAGINRDETVPSRDRWGSTKVREVTRSATGRPRMGSAATVKDYIKMALKESPDPYLSPAEIIAIVQTLGWKTTSETPGNVIRTNIRRLYEGDEVIVRDQDGRYALRERTRQKRVAY